jgi:hypothetical protein
MRELLDQRFALSGMDCPPPWFLKFTTSGICSPLAEQILGVLSGLYSGNELRVVAVH